MQPLDLFVSWKNELPQLSILESFFFNNITSNLNSNWNQNILTNWRHGYVCSDNGKLLVTENFCDKISHSICTQIKENGNNDRSLRWKPLIASWLFVCHLKRCPVDSIQSCFDTSLFATILSRFDTHLKLTQYKLKSLFHTKLWDTWQSKIIIEFPHLELAGDTGRFVPLWGSSDFPLNQAGFREEVQHIQLAEKVPRPPDKRFRCTLGSIQHGRQVTRNNVLVSYNNWSANQRNYSGDVYFMKWILIGKAEYVHGKWFFGSIISKSR